MINLLKKSIMYYNLATQTVKRQKTIELDYYELSKIYATLKAKELYDTTMEKCLMDGFDKIDNTASNEKDDIKTLNDKFFKSVDESIDRKFTMKYGEVIESPSNDEYIKLAEESSEKIKNAFKIPKQLLD